MSREVSMRRNASQNGAGIMDLIRSVWRVRWFALVGMALGLIIGLAWVLTRQPLYQSEALLATPRSDESGARLSALLGQAGQLGALLGMPAMGATDANETVAVIRSRDFSIRFARDRGIVQQLFPGRWDARSGDWKPAPSLFGGGRRETPDAARAPPAEEVLRKLEKWRSVAIDRRTGMIRATMRAPTPTLARDWLQAMIVDVNADIRKRQLNESSRAVRLIRERMAQEPLAEVRTGLAMLLESELKREVAAQTRPDFALRTIDPPNLPEQQIWPRPLRHVAVAAFIGMLLGAIGGGFVTLVRDRRRSNAKNWRPESAG